MKTFNVGIVGLKSMGKAHSRAMEVLDAGLRSAETGKVVEI